MNQLYFIEIAPFINDSILGEMIVNIASDKKARLLRYRHDIDRKIGIYADVLIRCLISMKSGADYREVDIKTGRTGKPYSVGFPDCEFNISHTRNAVAAAISDKAIGVDIEKVRDIDLGIADRVFSHNELVRLHGETADKNLRFFEIWTKKEALIKYDGTGLSNDLRARDVTGSFAHEVLSTFRIDDYIISTCSETEIREDALIKISEPELIAMWRNLVH